VGDAVGRLTWNALRNVSLHFFGIALVGNEVFFEPAPRTEVLLFAAAIFGLPLTLKRDEDQGR
jgi:hypothetical protein